MFELPLSLIDPILVDMLTTVALLELKEPFAPPAFSAAFFNNGKKVWVLLKLFIKNKLQKYSFEK